jgi:MoaA/NifB/PqqE/SkfB family radical SAM enzyme
MKQKTYKYIMDNKFILKLFYYGLRVVPNSKKIIKYKNIIKNLNDIVDKNTILLSNPINTRIAPIAVCNYGCLFCEIHKDNLLYPSRSKNIMNLKQYKNYESFLATTYNLSFYGGSEEPLLNSHFGEIVQYLKSKYGIKMMVNTNASTMNEKLSNILVEYGFDDILISYHAATEDGYLKLMTGDINKINKNIEYLQNLKKNKNTKLPIIKFNFALHKENLSEAIPVLDKAKEYDIDYVLANKYYGGRNKLQDKLVSYEYDLENGKKELDKIYQYANDNNIRLIPSTPDYWKEYENITWNTNNYNKNKKCFEPWKSIHFNPVLSNKDSHYIGVCNRIELFRIDYSKLDLSNQKDFEKIWNHPILQYMRKTVNSEDINPICKYCKNYDRETIRNTDSNKYAEVRDNAVEEFLLYCHNNLISEDIDGLEVLKENPSSDRKFFEKLKEL